MMLLTSAKSRFTSPGTVMSSEMPLVAWMMTSSATANDRLLNVVPKGASLVESFAVADDVIIQAT
ncbi:MAG: hypothetical protein ACKOC6_00600, partial [bacterium]